jgi:hypothetical protein
VQSATNSNFISLFVANRSFGRPTQRKVLALLTISSLLEAFAPPSALPSSCSSVDFFVPAFHFNIFFAEALFFSYVVKQDPIQSFLDFLPIFSQMSVCHVLQPSTTNHVDRDEVLLHVASNPNLNPLCRMPRFWARRRFYDLNPSSLCFMISSSTSQTSNSAPPSCCNASARFILTY